MNSLDAIPVIRKSGSEPFLANTQPTGIDVLSFWQWSSSNLLGNAMRGILAEYIVAAALGCHRGTRTEWDGFDVKTPNGIRVEVKSSGYLQSWTQTKLSKIQFSIKSAHGWDALNQKRSSAKTRQSDVHVFCVLAHKSKQSVDPLNIDQWDFYVASTATLDEEMEGQKTISLKNLLKLDVRKATYHELSDVVHDVASCQ